MSNHPTIPPRHRRIDDPPPPADPFDAVLAILGELSTAIRGVSSEVREMSSEVCGRLDGQSRAMQELATEVRAFGNDATRLKGRLVMLEALEEERRAAPNAE